MSHVFISYNQEDADFAGLLMMRLEKAGFDTWMDKSRLRAGSDWSISIDNGINDAFALVVIMSPPAKSSEYVTYEWSFAIGSGIPVLPVLRRQTELHPRLSRLQYLNFTHDQPWEKLVDELSELQKEGTPSINIPRDTPPYIRHAIASLDSSNPVDRECAIDALSESEHSIAAEALLSALHHPLRDVRFAAALVLAVKGDNRAMPELINALPQYHDSTSLIEYRSLLNKVYFALNRIGEQAIQPLVEALGTTDKEIHRIVVRALGDLKAEQAVPMLSSEFNGHGEWIDRYQTNMIETLCMIGGPAAVETLVSAWRTIPDSIKNVHLYDSPRASNLLALSKATIHLNSREFISALLGVMHHACGEVAAYSILTLDHFVKHEDERIEENLVQLLERDYVVNLEFMRGFAIADGRKNLWSTLSEITRLRTIAARSLLYISSHRLLQTKTREAMEALKEKIRAERQIVTELHQQTTDVIPPDTNPEP